MTYATLIFIEAFVNYTNLKLIWHYYRFYLIPIQMHRYYIQLTDLYVNNLPSYSDFIPTQKYGLISMQLIYLKAHIQEMQKTVLFLLYFQFHSRRRSKSYWMEKGIPINFNSTTNDINKCLSCSFSQHSTTQPSQYF